MRETITNNEIFPEPEKIKIEIDSPRFEELREADLETLHNRWRTNHIKLVELIKQIQLPFFGLHGTSRINLEGILEKKNPYINLATFYEKDTSEKFLYQLYSALLYTYSYTRERSPAQKQSSGQVGRGGVIVFNLEEDSENITHPWEHLLPGGGDYFTLNFDSETETSFWDSLSNSHNLLFRTDHSFTPVEFDKRLAGVIDDFT